MAQDKAKYPRQASLDTGGNVIRRKLEMPMLMLLSCRARLGPLKPAFDHVQGHRAHDGS